MKRIGAILLFVLLISPFLVGYWSLKSQIHHHKRKVKWAIAHQSSTEDLVKFTFSRAEVKKLDWKHSKEFKYKNEMYDIVRKSEGEDSITYWCWWDSEETMLYRQLAVIWNQNNNQDPYQKNTKSRLKSFWNSFFITTNTILSEVCFIEISSWTDNKCKQLHMLYFPPDPPPPQFSV